jgi:hypothetical protein
MAISRLPGGQIKYEGSLKSRTKRMRISVSILALRGLFWLSSTAGQLWRNVLDTLFGPTPLMLLPPAP